ncbi:MAG: AMP-binding protein, partial [Planctomycetota bacterium]
YGILKAGGVFIILAGSLKGAKLKYIMDNSGADILITHVGKAKVVKDALGDDPGRRKVIWVGAENRIPEEFTQAARSWDEIFSDFADETGAAKNKPALPRCVDVDLATLIYTSGSTGEPKGVMSTHHNMISAARSIIQYIGNSEDDIILDVLPLSFDYGLYQVIMAFMFGGTVVLERSFLYLHSVLERIAQEKVTGFPIVPTIVAMLLKLQDLTQYDFSSLRYMTNTGAALPVEHIRRLRGMFPEVTMISMFGLTECKRVSYLPPAELDRIPSSVGKAMPNCEVFVVDEDGNEVPPGETGELVIRGSNVMETTSTRMSRAISIFSAEETT